MLLAFRRHMARDNSAITFSAQIEESEAPARCHCAHHSDASEWGRTSVGESTLFPILMNRACPARHL